MAKRGTNAQQAHDVAVQELAERYRAEGWDVWADVDGWPTPPSIEGRRPDILTRDGDARLIIEVETERGADTAQHERFRRESEDDPETMFRGVVVDLDGEVEKRFS